MEHIYTTYLLLLLPSIILCETVNQSPTSTRTQTCTIESDLKKAIHSAPSTIQDIIIQFPSRLPQVLGKYEVLIAGDNIRSRASEIRRLLTHYTDQDHRAHLAEINRLNTKQSKVDSFWISNKISVTNASKIVIESLAKVRSLKSCVIRKAVISTGLCNSSPKNKTQETSTDRNTSKASSGTSYTRRGSLGSFQPEGNLISIGAPVAWNAGFYGQGVTVAVIDSGVVSDHEVLNGKFGGYWYDTVDHSNQPIDPHGHGTGVTGIIVGRDIGVAPGAQWIACRALDANKFGREPNLIYCAQWIYSLLTLPSRPQNLIVNNSWGAETLQGSPFFNDVILAWDSVGIHHVFSIGNTGPHCATGSSPGDQEVAFSVGNVDNYDTPHPTSSRGPNPFQGSVIPKPDIAAPGVNILMAGRNDPYDYVRDTGTSMAAPHVAGAMALILSRFRMTLPVPQHTRHLRALILHHARTSPVRITPEDRRCYSNGFSPFPNAATGYGVLDISRIDFSP